jgi:hypothetical protein
VGNTIRTPGLVIRTNFPHHAPTVSNSRFAEGRRDGGCQSLGSGMTQGGAVFGNYSRVMQILGNDYLQAKVAVYCTIQ